MKRCICLTIFLAMLLSAPSLSFSGGVTLRYHFEPGQQWECTRMNRMSFVVMGQKHNKKQRDTIFYTVAKGPKKGWVRVSARLVAPAGETDPNPAARAKYDLTFSADVHLSGDTRNIAVAGIEEGLRDPSLDAQSRAVMKQHYDIMADSMPALVFWFPELPEGPLQAGDEFEDKRTHGLKSEHMKASTKSRKTFVFEEVSEGLAYFSTIERHATQTSTMGMKTDQTSAGKGETIFDLKAGMWLEYTSKSKMRFSGAAMGGGGDQEMLITEKVLMQRR